MITLKRYTDCNFAQLLFVRILHLMFIVRVIGLHGFIIQDVHVLLRNKKLYSVDAILTEIILIVLGSSVTLILLI